MDTINQSELKLILEFGAIENSTMQLTITNNNNVCVLDPAKSQIIEHVMKISLPTEIDLVVAGKNMMSDTRLDDSGQIIADKYIKICSMEIDGIAVPTAWLEKKILLITDTQTVASNYFGHNGTCKIIFSKPNAFLQILSFSKELT